MRNAFRILIIVVLLLGAGLAHAQSAGVLVQQAEAAYLEKQYARAAELFVGALDAGFDLPEIAYSAASCYALAGDKGKAFAYLDRLVAMSYTNPDPVKNDPDLLSLHDDPRWQKVLSGLEKNQRQYQAEQAALWDSPSLASPFKPELTEDERIAGLSKFWSEIKYNFVFPERLVEVEWDRLYVDYLPKVRAAKSSYEYYRILEELCAKLKDSHTNVYAPAELLGSAGLHTRLIDGKVMVLEVWDPELRSQGIAPGMELAAINGEPVRQYAEREVAPYQSASGRQDLEVRTFEYYLLAGRRDESLQLTLQTAEGHRITRTIRLKTYKVLSAFLPKTPGFEFRVLPGNIGYVALNSFEDDSTADQFIAAFDKIAQTDALILDVRNNGGGNSSVGLRILSTLIDKPAWMTNWQTRDYRPIDRAWGRPIGMLSVPSFDVTPDDKHHYAKPVIVLSSPRTFSATEDFLVAFDESGRGTIMGEPSAGSTGQPLSFKLPGGGSGRVLTRRDTYADGRVFLGVGVQPQKVVVPTLRDYRAGKDTVLEAALAELHAATGKK